MIGRIQWCIILLCILSCVTECKKFKRKGRAAKDRNDGKSSLAFVFDVTGSMYNDLKQLREGAEMILNTALKESDIIANFVFVPFHDPRVGPATVTKKKDVFKKALNIVRVYGGGDCPEMSLTGIEMALNVSKPRSFLYVFTDATSADHRKVAHVLDTIQRKQSQVVFILTGHCNDLDRPSYKVYQQIAAASSGQIFNLNKTNVHKMLEFVKSSIKSRTVNLASVSNPAGYNFTQEIPIDSTLGEVTVSVSGAKPKITVVDPKGEQLTGPPKLITTVDLSEIMVVKVMQPEPGNWVFTVGSEEDYSVKVVGLSNLTFNHGFSVEKPTSMLETSYRPLKGTYNYMMISLTQTNVTVDIQYAEVLTLDGQTLFEVPLKQVDSINKVYLAEPFIPPDDFFYIAIIGRDQYKQDLRRVGATAIQAKTPDVPYLTTPKTLDAKAHSRVVLTCDVESLVPVKAMWTKDSSRIQQEVTSLQTTSIDFVIEDMQEQHVGTYRCIARNVAGVSKASTDLNIIVEPPQVTIEPQNTTIVEVGDNITLTCTVYSEALLLENRLVFNGTNTSYAIDVNKEPTLDATYTYQKTIQVEENDTGTYFCVASNRGGKTNRSTAISIKMDPTAQIIGPHTFSKLINSDFQLVCAVEHATTVVWTAPNNTEVQSIEVNGTHNDVLDVKNVTEDGTWTCIAIRGDKKSGSDSVNIAVLIKPVVTIEGDKNITVLNGTMAEVVCLVVAKPVPRVLWHRETEDFLNNTITEINPTTYRSVLTLNSSAESINGTYFCFGENSEGIHQDSITVNVRRKMTVLQGFQDLSVQLYYQVELQCVIDAYPPAAIHWYHNDTALEPTDDMNLSEDNTTLYLKRVDFDDLGEYICEAENEYEKVEVRGTIIVEGLETPVLLKEPDVATALEGTAAVITCRLLQGNPEPTISWHHPFEENPSVEVVDTDGQSDLVIAQVRQEHAGLYRCVATNVLGQDSYVVAFDVQHPPKLLNAETEDKEPLEVEVGEGVTLSCEASGQPPPTTQWTKDGHALDFTDHISESPAQNLVIKEVLANDSGMYICNVTSALGSTHRNFTLNVYDPPTIPSTSDSIQEVLEGHPVELPCKAQGVPAPVVQWTHNEEPLPNDKHVDEYGLRFTAKVSDVGNYTCTASNDYGNTSVTYELRVLVPPKLLETGTEDKGPLEVEVGGEVTLSCEASGQPPPTTQWTKDGHALDFTDHISVTPSRQLVIKEASANNSGTYTCNVTSALGSTHRNFTLTVYDPPTISPTANLIHEVLEGQLIELPCKAQGIPAPVVQWIHNGEPTSSDKHIDEHGLRFTAKVSDVGNYTCTASNEYGNTSVTYELQVLVPPKLLEAETEDKKPLEVAVGEEVTLSCEASGQPPPTTVWTKDGHALVFTNNISVTSTRDLVIKEASAYNSGTYTCNVTSALGSTHRNFTLTVYDPPTISSTADPIQEVLEGQLVELPCKAQGIPAPVVQWTHNEEPIPNDKYVDERGLRFVANLTDFGNYTCTASNDYGNTSVSYELHVWVPPFVIPPSEVSKDVLVGSEAMLQCDVIGFPVPTVQWTFEQQLLKENTTDVKFNDIGNIYISNASPKHEGEYACVAENIGGVAEHQMFLKVNEPPKMLEDNYTGPYIATSIDSVLTIGCRATGRPEPYVMWAKDDFYLNRDPRYTVDTDGTLYIKSPSEDMSGNYTCVARNSVGQINKTVPVQIYSIPTPTQSEESLTTLTLVEGTAADIDCPVRATSQTLKWYKNAELIATGRLHLPSVSRDNASTYSCVATNAVGSAHANVLLIVEWKPRLLQHADNVLEKVRDEDCYLNCEVDAKPGAKTKWVFNSKPLVFEDKSYLKLINVQLHNAGSYKCIVSNVHGTVIKEFSLKVSEPPFISDFDMMDVQLKQGDNATLECNAKGFPAPKVSWTYNNTHWQANNSTLSAVNITSAFEGLYRCDATNKAGTTHIVYRVSVIFAAKVEDIVAFVDGEGANVGNAVEVVQGSNMRIACKASGNPVPDIQWLKQGRAMSENSYDSDYADLSLYSAETSQAGLYTCVASNEGGSDQRRIKLDVLEPPKIFQSLFDTSNSSEVKLEVISDQSFYLHCHPYGNPMPEVYWFKNDVPLKLFDDTMVSTEFGEVIVVKKALEEQSGNYTCVARNKVGNASVNYQVEVLVPPPSPKESIKKVSATFGNELIMVCPSMGTQPNVMWIKHPYTEISSNDRVSLVDDNFTLIINKTEVSDSGKYSCILTNKVGTTEVTFDVTVHKPPSIAGNVGTNIVEGHVVPMRRSVVLKCEADGHPMPQITWLKDTQQLSESVSNIQRVLGNSLLAIWSAEARDAGQYICVAENRAGTAHRRYNVAVQVPAKWSPWTSWSLCNVSCGLGYQTRSRMCYFIDEHNNTIDKTTNSEKLILDESACKGPSDDRRKCHMPPCDVDESKARWSQWSHWSECSATCGVGTQSRTRRCKGKAKCEGDNVQIRKCPQLPSCSPTLDSADNDVFDSDEDNTSDTDRYMPEQTYEMQPEVINSHYSSDVQEFYSASGAQSATVFYDVDVTDNLDGSEHGPCDPGYRHNATANTCDDVDECTVEVNQCHSTQVCVNTAGAYRCSCSPGYLALGAGQRCLDINECELETDGCEYSCVNTAGGYVCACPKHLRLHLDRHHCVIPALYRRPLGELETEYLSTSIDFPTKYTKPIRNV